MRGSEVSVSVVKRSSVKRGEVLQCSYSTNNKVSDNIIRQKTIGSCCLYSMYVFSYYHILFYSLGFIFYQHMVVFLFNTVIYVFLLLGVRILIIRLP